MAEYTKHPSFANLYIGRSQCSGKQALYGSSIKHSDIITLKISPSYIGRSLHNDHYYVDTQPYIEIDMSQAQFAQAITSLNMGEGTPVTLRRLNGQYIEECPFEDKRTQFDTEFSTDMNTVVQKFDDDINEIESILAQKRSLTKADKERILAAVHHVQRVLGSDMPFLFSQFNRQMEKTVTEAKAEVEGYIHSRMDDLAINNLQGKVSAEESLGEGNNDERISEPDEGMTMGGM